MDINYVWAAINAKISKALKLFETMQTCGLKLDDVTFINCCFQCL